MNEHEQHQLQTPNDALAAFARLHDDSHENAPNGDIAKQFTDAYFGEYDAPEDWAQELLADSDLRTKLDIIVPDNLRAYVQIDYAGLARDARLRGEIDIEPAPGGRVWVFLRQ